MKKSIIAAAISCLMASSACAGTLDDVIARLAAEGYTVKEVDKTLLGNYKIEAYKGAIEREVVYNPSLDQVLRDKTDDNADDGSRATGTNDDSSDEASSDDSGNESGDDSGGDGDGGSDGDDGGDHDGGDSDGGDSDGGDHDSGEGDSGGGGDD